MRQPELPLDRRFEHDGQPDLGHPLDQAVVKLGGPVRHLVESLVDRPQPGADPCGIEQRRAPQRLGRRANLGAVCRF